MSAIREGRVIAARYQLERPLARGGMGSVWLARHLQLESTLAIKFIEPQLAQLPEARGRFAREARVAAQLQGPNLVQIHDYGVDDDTPYMVMEHLQGEDLCARLNREKRLSLQATADIVNQVARVLRRAHEAGIIHRDLKPGNVFLVKSDDDDEIVKVLDFGLAKIPRSSLPDDMTKTGTLLGSPRYMSPEQARAMKNIDHRSDLWSLAVIAFRAATGELPFPGDEIGDVLVKICAEPPPVPSSIDPALSPAIDRFFARAFEHDPGKRFQSARELARAFTAATIGQTMEPSSTPALGGGIAGIDAPEAGPDPIEITRPSPTPPGEASAGAAAEQLEMAARLSWIGAPSESPAGLHLLARPSSARRSPSRRARLAPAAIILLLASAGVVVYVTLARGPDHPPTAPTATAILAEPTAQPSSAPAVTAEAALPPAPIAAITPPEPTIRPATPRPAGTTSAAAPRSAPKPPSQRRKNPILGI
jgi:eukaryotic-like serine/threonine-protein kinase